ncbi:MAG: tetratricopeptide repeat protein [Cytophagales bacterium]
MLATVSVVICLIFNRNSEKPIFSVANTKQNGDTSIPTHFNELAERYHNTNLDYSHKLSAKAAFFAQSMGFKSGEARAYNNMAEYYFLVNNDEKAIEYSDRAAKIFEKRNDYIGLDKSKNIVGRVFLKHEMFDQAEDVYKKQLAIAKDLADNTLMASNYASLGNVMKAQKKFSEAIHLYKHANKIYYKINDLKGQATCYTDLGLTHKKLNKFHFAIISFEKALTLLNDSDNQKAFVYLELGIAEANNENPEKALEYFKKAEEIEAYHEDNFDLSMTLLKQAETYLKLKNYEKALQKGFKGLEIAQSVGNKEVEVLLNNVISDSYAQKQNFKMAYEYKSKAEVLDEELTNESKIKALSKLQASMEFNKKLEQEKLKEQKLKEKLDEQVSTHNLLIGMFIPFLITVIFFVSKINISSNYIRAIVFVTIILTLEFLLVVLDPFIDKYTGGIPISKLIINTLLALVLAPLQHLLESYLKKKMFENKIEQKKSSIASVR